MELLVCFVCAIFILLSRKSDVALYFGRILTRLGVSDFQVSVYFFDFFPVNLLLVQSHHASRVNCRKASYPKDTITRRDEGGS